VITQSVSHMLSTIVPKERFATGNWLHGITEHGKAFYKPSDCIFNPLITD